MKAKVDYGSILLQWRDSGADAYRVTRGDGTALQCTAAELRDTAVELGKTYRYTVEALAWGGAASPPVSVEATMPAEIKRPPLPPPPDVQLVDLKPAALKNGYGKPGINKSVMGLPLRIEGKQYERGLGLHAHALAVYKIPAGAQQFVAVVGLDDEKRDDPRSSVAFEIYGDVKEMGEQPVLLGRSPVLSSKTVRSWSFQLDLDARLKELRIVVTDAGDGIASDHADLVEAGFVTKGR